MFELTHHQWKTIFTSVRKYQKYHCNSAEEYQEMKEILDILYACAYSETYTDHEYQNTNT